MQNLYSPVQIRSSPLLHRADSVCAVFFICLTACADPPDPPATPEPPDLPRWSTAPHVQWDGLSQLNHPTHPIALFVSQPDGALDRLAHDPDVATFLNDRFQPIFLTPDFAGRAEGLLFVSTQGCLLSESMPQTPTEWIALANQAILKTEGHQWGGVPGQPAEHVLSGSCQGD